MATLATAATIASVVATVAGAGITAAGTINAGRQAQSDANFQATQLEEQGKEEKAASQREALQTRRKTNFLLSRQQAVASSSGLGATDPTVLQLAGDVAQQGSYQEALSIYGGEQRQRGLNAQASAARVTGEAQKRGAYYSAAGGLASAAGSLFAKYGKGMPGADDLGGDPADFGNSYLYGTDYAGLT